MSHLGRGPLGHGTRYPTSNVRHAAWPRSVWKEKASLASLLPFSSAPRPPGCCFFAHSRGTRNTRPPAESQKNSARNSTALFASSHCVNAPRKERSFCASARRHAAHVTCGRGRGDCSRAVAVAFRESPLPRSLVGSPVLDGCPAAALMSSYIHCATRPFKNDPRVHPPLNDPFGAWRVPPRRAAARALVAGRHAAAAAAAAARRRRRHVATCHAKHPAAIKLLRRPSAPCQRKTSKCCSTEADGGSRRR
jgi:hypothetical protein